MRKELLTMTREQLLQALDETLDKCQNLHRDLNKSEGRRHRLEWALKECIYHIPPDTKAYVEAELNKEN